jgi:PAS domain S-box-containing protein
MDNTIITSYLPQGLIQSTSIYAIVIDLDGKYIFVNQYFKDKFSHISLNFIGLHVNNSIHPDDIEKCYLAVVECMTHPHKTIPIQIRKPSKIADEYFTSQWDFSLLTDDQHNKIGILCIGYDITLVTHHQQKSFNINKKFNNIIKNITDGLYILDKDWHFVEINEAAEIALGMSKNELLGKKIWDYFPDNDLFNYPKKIREAMYEHHTVQFIDYRPDIQKWFEVIVYSFDEGIMIFFKDITEKQNLYNQLQDSENKLKALFNSTTDSNFLLSVDLKVLYFNAVAQEDVKRFWNRDLKIGDDFRDFILKGTESAFLEDFNKSLQGETIIIEIELKLTTDVYRWFEIKYIPVYDQKHNLIGISFNSTNIDGRKRAEDKILKQNQVLREVAWRESHVVRRPVANILGIVELFKINKSLTEAEKELFMSYILDSAKELDLIIHTIVSKVNKVMYLED